MTFASALGQILQHIPERPTNRGARGIPQTIKIGDMSKEELLKELEGNISQLDGYEPEVKLLEKFFERLEVSPLVKEVDLTVTSADTGPRTSWYWYFGDELNGCAKNQRSLEFCTPEMVCKIFLWYKNTNDMGFFYVSCGDLICILSANKYTRDGKRRCYITVGNDRFKIDFAEDIVYVQPHKQEQQ